MGFKKGYTPWNKGFSPEQHPFYGRHHTEETKKKISISKKGKRASIRTEFKKGHKMPEDWKIKISEYQKQNDNAGRFRKGHIPENKFEKGHTPWNRGKTMSDEHRRILSEAHKGQVPWNKGIIFEQVRGENHWNWSGGTSGKGYPIGWTEILRNKIRERDDYTCQECKLLQEELEYQLDVHHIDEDKINLTHDNLVTLCRSCHTKKHVGNIDARAQQG